MQPGGRDRVGRWVVLLYNVVVGRGAGVSSVSRCSVTVGMSVAAMVAPVQSPGSVHRHWLYTASVNHQTPSWSHHAPYQIFLVSSDLNIFHANQYKYFSDDDDII